MMESFQGSGSTSPVRTVLSRRPDRIPGLSSLALPELNTKSSHCRNLFSPGPSTVLSPVTKLALDMDNLGGLGRFVSGFTCYTRRKSLSRKMWFSLHAISCRFSFFFAHTATMIPQKEENFHLWRRFPPLLLMFPLMLVSSTGIYIFSLLILPT